MANTTRSDERRPGREAAGHVEPPKLPPLNRPVSVRPPGVAPARRPAWGPGWGRALRAEGASEEAARDEPLAELQEELVMAEEGRQPEGVPPEPWSRAASVIALMVAGLFMVTAIALALARYFGWAALIVGMVLLVLYVIVGGGAEWVAGRLRTRDRRIAEREVVVRLRDFDRPGGDVPE